jgi:ATP-dependent Clp protease protease subunit
MKRKFENSIGSILAAPKYSACYAALARDRIIFVSEVITNDLASSFSGLLMHYDHVNQGEEIQVYINTDGGDSSALSHILDIMNMVISPISTICIGKAYSAGAFILAAGTKGKRFITKNASVMIHGVQCEFPTNRYTDQRNSQIYYDFLKSADKLVFKQLAEHTGKTYEQICEDCKKDTYFDAAAAKNYGLVDEIIG